MRRAILITAISIAIFVSEVALAESPSPAVRLPVTVPSTSQTHEVEVLNGDHLWKISKRHLDESDSESEVAPYWQKVIEVNLPTLRSGDPDLIYPGELVRLPNLDR